MRHLVLTTLLLLLSVATHGQQIINAAAIGSKEVISYNLYFNWQFIWVKVGTAAFTTSRTTYHGSDAIRTALITRGNGTADKYFVLRDTLTGYCRPDLAPLYYRKGAQEGSRYTVDEATYSYEGGRCTVAMHRQKHNGTHSYNTQTVGEGIVDMLHLFQRGRCYDLTKWQKGYEQKIEVVDGTKIIPAILRCHGRETIKGDDGIKYPCIKLSYIEIINGKEKTIATFFVSDDNQHIPIRLDLFLRFGSAKAFLTSKKIS